MRGVICVGERGTRDGQLCNDEVQQLVEASLPALTAGRWGNPGKREEAAVRQHHDVSALSPYSLLSLTKLCGCILSAKNMKSCLTLSKGQRPRLTPVCEKKGEHVND